MALTFHSGNSSRWAPYCWLPSPVNPVRTSAGSPIHSHFLDTPFQPWPPAYAAPFKRKGQDFLCFWRWLTQATLKNNGCATTAGQAIGRGSQSVKWKPDVHHMDPQFIELYEVDPQRASIIRRWNLLNPRVWTSKADGLLSARPRSYYFSANPMTFLINLSLVLVFSRAAILDSNTTPRKRNLSLPKSYFCCLFGAP